MARIDEHWLAFMLACSYHPVFGCTVSSSGRPLTLFEFILVMVSLILAIGVTHLLEGFARVARDRQRFDVDWITPVWGVFLFLLSIGHWWSL